MRIFCIKSSKIAAASRVRPRTLMDSGDWRIHYPHVVTSAYWYSSVECSSSFKHIILLRKITEVTNNKRFTIWSVLLLKVGI